MPLLEVQHVQKIYTTRFGGTQVQASVVLRASRPDGAVTEAADLLARRVRYLSPRRWKRWVTRLPPVSV